MNAPSHPASAQIAVRPRWRDGPAGQAAGRARRRWYRQAMRGLNREAVLAKVADEAALSWRYIFMTTMSAGIAILGLLLSSPAVVIGAMLLSPLMGPMLGAGFALSTGNFRSLRASARSLVAGIAFAVAFCALIVLFSPLQTITGEIAARTRPNLFDLLVALFSALAGAYAMIRGREGTIVGVAIATAVMPPLAVVGFGLATWNWAVFSGALLLFVTNALTITLTATVMARLYGFRSRATRRSGWLQGLGILLAFALLAAPLGVALKQIALEASGERLAQTTLGGLLDEGTRISELAIDWNAKPIAVSATVLTPTYRPQVEAVLAQRLSAAFGQPVVASVEQLQVGTYAGAADAAALAQSAGDQPAVLRRQADILRRQLALLAGTGREAVLIDPSNRRAVVTARPLDGTTLVGWRELEVRAQGGAPGWQVAIRPPALPLPSVTLTDGAPDAEGERALEVIGWAARRTGLPVALSGGGEARQAITDRLRGMGVVVTDRGGGPANRVEAEWSLLQGEAN